MSDLPQIRSWGMTRAAADERFAERLDARELATLPLARGLGRSYGDSSLPPPDHAAVLNTTLADRILAWDDQTGLLRAEAGLSLRELNRLWLFAGGPGDDGSGRTPRWFTPVTPGTQFVTLGGMVASDVHGKNHHVAGCYGQHVRELVVRVADGRVITCNREQHADLFRATLGGMGLTGHVLEVEVQMERAPTPWILGETLKVPNIDAYMDALEESARDWPMTVGWIDCLTPGEGMGRGLLNRGRWAKPDEAPSHTPKAKPSITFPFVVPSGLVNKWTMRAFCALYYHKSFRRLTRGVVHPESFFYPLDAIRHWNRAYGHRGFTQFQCVLPRSAGKAAARRFLEALTASGGASFLCVIKDCGPEGEGMLSFPMEGISIAVDLPITPGIQALVDGLNEVVIADGGRIYLTKDTFTRPEHYARMDPRLPAFNAVRDVWDPGRHFRSAQSVRMLGDAGATAQITDEGARA